MTLSKSDFKRLNAFQRGYAVYMLGKRKDEPNVPNERNPFPKGSIRAKRWAEGQNVAALDAQDSEE